MENLTPADPETPSPKGKAGRFGRKGFRLFGLGLQDLIKFFFSGNASLAIIILILICFFLAREAVMFFPDHHKGLQSYRKAGQEFVDYLSEEIDTYTTLYSNANVAYFAEMNRTSETDDKLLGAFRSVLVNVENATKRTRDQLEDHLDDLEDVQDDLEDAEDEDERAELAAEKAKLDAGIAKLRPALRAASNRILEKESTWKLENSDIVLTDELRKTFAEAVLAAEPEADDHPFIADLKKTSADKKAAEAEKLVDFKASVTALRDAAKPLRELHSELKKVAIEARKEADRFETAPARRAAMLKGAAATEDAEEKARKLKIANAVVVEEPDYAALTQPIYDSVDRHREIIGQFRTDIERIVQGLPEQTKTASAREKLEYAREAKASLVEVIARNREKILEWRHDEPVSAGRSVIAFLFGKNWVTNSSWHDFYGLMPLFLGSLMISTIAILISVPFSVAAAVYVNQLASHREQSIVKPAIEFIGAIPSVVLGFFGVLVLGEFLRNVSQVEWLAWIPGFPMSERLTILNAGLLLAFMATPTIFTLAEDALNNVPKAFAENSLALGASKLQTIFRVIVPTAVSGIIASILLGFGRIIGETMVVLLVAGNKIKIPDFSAGIGVVAQPAHTMTGIIAQELGEVDNGSLHWRALFMVGMVLFFLSLLVNYSAQQILRRFQKV